MQADSTHRRTAPPGSQQDPARLADLWRAGLLDAREQQGFEQAMAASPELVEHAAYGRRLASSLEALPQLARRGARHAPRRARRVHWPRLLGTGMAAAALAGLSFGLLPTLLRTPSGAPQQIQTNPQMADAVQNLDFYEWLAAHPGALGQANDHGGTA